MFKWLKWFKRKEIIGYQVYNHRQGVREDRGFYPCGAEEALERAQHKALQDFFNSNSGEALVMNLEAVPVRKEK